MQHRWLMRFTFEREAHWMLWLYVVIPLVGLIIAVLIPPLIRWQVSSR
jgi:hypothetical protein